MEQIRNIRTLNCSLGSITMTNYEDLLELQEKNPDSDIEINDDGRCYKVDFLNTRLVPKDEPLLTSIRNFIEGKSNIEERASLGTNSLQLLKTRKTMAATVSKQKEEENIIPQEKKETLTTSLNSIINDQNETVANVIQINFDNYIQAIEYKRGVLLNAFADIHVGENQNNIDQSLGNIQAQLSTLNSIQKNHLRIYQAYLDLLAKTNNDVLTEIIKIKLASMIEADTISIQNLKINSTKFNDQKRTLLAENINQTGCKKEDIDEFKTINPDIEIGLGVISLVANAKEILVLPADGGLTDAIGGKRQENEKLWAQMRESNPNLNQLWQNALADYREKDEYKIFIQEIGQPHSTIEQITQKKESIELKRKELLTTIRCAFADQLGEIVSFPPDAGLTEVMGGRTPQLNTKLLEEVCKKNPGFNKKWQLVCHEYKNSAQFNEFKIILADPESTAEQIAVARNKLEHLEKQMAFGLRCALATIAIVPTAKIFAQYVEHLATWEQECFSIKTPFSPPKVSSINNETLNQQSKHVNFNHMTCESRLDEAPMFFGLSVENPADIEPKKSPRVVLSTAEITGPDLNGMLNEEKNFYTSLSNLEKTYLTYIPSIQPDDLTIHREAQGRTQRIESLLAAHTPGSTPTEMDNITKRVAVQKEFATIGQDISRFFDSLEKTRQKDIARNSNSISQFIGFDRTTETRYSLETQARLNSLKVLQDFCYGNHVEDRVLRLVLDIYSELDLPWEKFTDFKLVKAVVENHQQKIMRSILDEDRSSISLESITYENSRNENITLINPTYEELNGVRKLQKVQTIRMLTSETKETLQAGVTDLLGRGDELHKLLDDTHKLIHSTQQLESKSLKLKNSQDWSFSGWLSGIIEQGELTTRQNEQNKKIELQKKKATDAKLRVTSRQEEQQAKIEDTQL